MDQGVLLNTISEQRNAALNQVAISNAQLATANKTIADLQAQCDALNAKLNAVSKNIVKAGGDAVGPKRRGPRKANPEALNGTADPSEMHEATAE